MVLRAHTINTDIMQLAWFACHMKQGMCAHMGRVRSNTAQVQISSLFKGGATMKWPRGDIHINKKVTKGHQKVDQKWHHNQTSSKNLAPQWFRNQQKTPNQSQQVAQKDTNNQHTIAWQVSNKWHNSETQINKQWHNKSPNSGQDRVPQISLMLFGS